MNCIFCKDDPCGVVVNVLAPSVIYQWFESWFGQTKDHKMCCFFAERTALGSKMQLIGLLSGQPTQVEEHVYTWTFEKVLVASKAYIEIISSKRNLFLALCRCKCAHLAFSRNHSLTYGSVNAFLSYSRMSQLCHKNEYLFITHKFTIHFHNTMHAFCAYL